MWSTTTTLRVVANFTVPILPTVDQHVHDTATLSTQMNVEEVDRRLRTMLLGPGGFTLDQVTIEQTDRMPSETRVWMWCKHLQPNTLP